MVDFEEVGHKYSVWVDGEELGQRDSVTKILKAVDMGKSDAFAWWGANEAVEYLRRSWSGEAVGIDKYEELLVSAGKAYSETRDEAADVGKRVHAWLEAHINAKLTFGEDPPLPTDEQAANAVSAYLKHESEHHVSYEDSERVVYSLAHDYIGTLDQTHILMVDEALALADYKTSRDTRISYRLQLAAYAKALMEENPEKRILKRYVYLLGKEDAEFRAIDLRYQDMTDEESLEFDFAGFLAAKEVYKWGVKAVAAQPPKKRKKKAA